MKIEDGKYCEIIKKVYSMESSNALLILVGIDFSE